MRGRRGRPQTSSSVSQGQNRMALRKQIQKDASDIPSVSQIEDTQEDEAPDDKDELSLSMLATARGKRRGERANKSKAKEMTEEEMMDLALRLSEREASMTALKLREEEEDMMKAIQESMVSQTQLYPPSQSQSILGDADASISVSSRRKLLYPNGKKPFDGDQVTSEPDYTPGEEKSRGPKEGEDEPKNMNKMQKRLDGSPLMEMPDSNIRSQASPSSGSESLLVPLDSPQSSDSTQIEDCQLRKSPVFPLTTGRAQVCISRLSQDVLQNCTASGFVLCSQDSCTQKSLSTQPQSPTFPKSPACVNNVILPETTPSLKHGALSETDQEDDTETQLSPQYCRSPVFGRTTQSEDPPSALRAESRGCENSGFISLSQESLTSTSCQPRSPVFNKDIMDCKSPGFSETDQRQDTKQSRSSSKSPVFGRTRQKQNTVALAAELRDPNGGGNPPSCSSRGSERLRQDIDLDTSDEDRCNYIMVSPRPDDNEEELTEAWNSVERELTSDMTLHWSDEDTDVIPVDSPSPVFPEERADHQAGGQTPSQKLLTAASPQTNCSLKPQKCHSASLTNKSSSIRQTSPGPLSSSASTCHQHPAPSAEPLTGQTVHYYWGVPFCPRGLDPDSYTKVILAQMEVYEKSVKQAQRCLMKKAEWGEAILPQPEKSPSPESASESPQLHLPRRRILRRRGNNPCEDTDTPTAEAEEEEDDKKEEDREEKKEEEEEEETQLSDNDSTQDLMMDTDAAAELRVKSPELPEVQEILQDEAPTMDKQHQENDEDMEVDVETEDPEDRETDRNKPMCDAAEAQTVGPEDRTDPDVEEVLDRGSLQRSKSPELEPAAVPQSPESNVDCPICQRSFPVSEIEMHAAYCDGDIAVVDEVSVKPRRKRARRAEVAPEETNHTSITGKSGQKQEKCYICQKAVPLRDYSRHTELCIHRSGSKMAATGSLLSALDRTESRDSEAGPSGSRVHPGEIIDLRNEEEEEDGVATIRVSNSPIRSFTPISEVSDCLIDFRKQHRPKKPSQRRR